MGAYSWWVINRIILRIAYQREYHLGQPINTEQSTINSIGFYANLYIEHFNNAHVYKIKTPGNPCSKKNVFETDANPWRMWQNRDVH